MNTVPSSHLTRRASDQKHSIEKALIGIVFSSRWLQAPLYLGLIVAQGVYVYHFMTEIAHLLSDLNHINETSIMLIVLGLIDVVMISNLLIMVIIGGYETFVSRLNLDGHPDAPGWLSHVNVNTMKIKLALALVGISSVHLLKTFIDIEHLAEKGDQAYFIVGGQLAIHFTFVLSAILVAYTSRISQTVSE